MKITPLDIKKQEFKKAMRGFDSVEVETFLEMVAEEFEQLIKEKNNLADEVLKLKTQLHDYQQVEKTFKDSLMSAQQTINQSRENSKKEANLIIKEAEVKAEKMLEETKIKLIEMKNELMIIKSQKDSFARRLRHLLESQLELIGVLELDDLGLGQVDKNKKLPNIERALNEKPPREGSAKNNREALLRERQNMHEKKNDRSVNKSSGDKKNIKFSDQFIL
ncbi:DivIVA domain-containing protein [candidate division KSB1 bacterium]|nr:DivIVA domain-containing protein [candidate division KSB1 bacterium]